MGHKEVCFSGAGLIGASPECSRAILCCLRFALSAPPAGFARPRISPFDLIERAGGLRKGAERLSAGGNLCQMRNTEELFREEAVVMRMMLRLIARIQTALGALAGLALALLVLIQFGLVVMSAVFAEGSIWLQESRLYLNALIFLGAAGYTLMRDAHVRVDIFFNELARRDRALVDILGTLLFLLPFLALLWWAAVPYVADSWAIREGSTETGGIPFVYGLKSLILMFAATMTLEALALLLSRALRVLDDDTRPRAPGERP